MLHDASFQTVQGVKFKAIFEVISPLLMECTMDFKPDGLVIKGVAPNLFASLWIRKSHSDTYTIRGLEHSVGLDLRKITILLRAVSSGDLVSLELPNQHEGAIQPHMVFRHWNDQKISEYNIPLLDIPSLGAPLLDTGYIYAVVDAQVLHTEIKYLSRVGEFLVLALPNKKELVLKAFDKRGNVCGVTSLRATVPAQKVMGGVKQYPIRVLRLISKAASFSTSCRVGLRERGEIQLDYDIGPNMNLRFTLTPVEELKRPAPLKRSLTTGVADVCTVCSHMVSSRDSRPDPLQPGRVVHKDCGGRYSTPSELKLT